MPDYSVTCFDAASTAQAGAALAPLLRTGDVVLLYGDLGAGKTTWTRGLIQALSPDIAQVVSPTFTLVQLYDTPRLRAFHYDLYRLPEDAPDAVLELGWDDSLLDGLVLVEWPQRLGHLTPADALTVHIDTCEDGSRRVNYGGNAAWSKRLQHLPQILSGGDTQP